MLNFNFLGAADPPCFDACDVNDDGQFRGSVTDAVYLLNFNFLGGPGPLSPYPQCGMDVSADDLTCDVYELCSDCFGEEDLDLAIAKNVPPVVCIPPDQVYDFGDLHITVCPMDLAPACGEPPARGCPVNFTRVQGDLDVADTADAKVLFQIEGAIDALPIRVEDTRRMTTSDCGYDVSFHGDAVVPVLLEERKVGEFTIVKIGSPTFDRATTEIMLTTVSGGTDCRFFKSLQDFFVEDLLTQLEAEADSLLDDLRPELVGQVACVE